MPIFLLRLQFPQKSRSMHFFGMVMKRNKMVFQNPENRAPTTLDFSLYKYIARYTGDGGNETSVESVERG